MGRAVKKVAKVAAVAAAVYFGGPAIAGAIKGGLSSTLISGAGLALNVAGQVQARKVAGQQTQAIQEQTTAQNKADEARNRYNQLLQKRQRLQVIKTARITQGQVGGQMATSGLGTAGTSSFTGAVGSVGSQTAANLGNINVAQGTGNQISGFNQAAADAGTRANIFASEANQYESIATLGGTIAKAPQLFT